MDKESRNAAIGAACVLFGFGIAAYFMPRVMLGVGAFSTVAAGGIAILFVAAFFAVFWWRSRRRRGE